MIIPEEVLKSYGLSPQATVAAAGGTRNANFCVREGDRAIFLRRRHRDYCDEGWLSFDHEALIYLSERGAPVSAPLSHADGGTWLHHGEDVYEAYPWISGNTFPATRQALRSVAENLAAFHRAGESYPGDYVKGGHRRREMAPERLVQNLEASKGISGEGDEIVSYYLSQVQLGASRLDDEIYCSLPMTLVHGDVQPGNAIFDDSSLLVFVDYDWMSIQPVIYDLAFALILFCSRRESPVDGADIWSLSASFEFDGEAAIEFMETYMGTYGELPAEMRPALMEQLRLSWAHIRIDGARKVPAPDRPRFLARDPTGPFEWIEERRDGDWF